MNVTADFQIQLKSLKHILMIFFHIHNFSSLNDRINSIKIEIEDIFHEINRILRLHLLTKIN